MNNLKKCLIDTNIISEILKGNLHLNEKYKLKFAQDYQIIIPLMIIAELAETDNLISELVEYSKNQKIIISKPSFMLFNDEVESFENNNGININLIDLSKEVLEDEQGMQSYFSSTEFFDAVNQLKNEEATAIENIQKIKNYDYEKRKDYIKDYLLTKISVKAPQLYDKVLNMKKTKLNHFRSVVIQGAFLFYKHITKKTKDRDSDAYDALMIPTVAYVDVFITETTNGSLLKEMRNSEEVVRNLEVLAIKEIKC